MSVFAQFTALRLHFMIILQELDAGEYIWHPWCPWAHTLSEGLAPG